MFMFLSLKDKIAPITGLMTPLYWEWSFIRVPKFLMTAAYWTYRSSWFMPRPSRDSLSLISTFMTSRALILVLSYWVWRTLLHISFKIVTKWGSKKSAPKVSRDKLIRSFALSAISSLRLLSCFKKQMRTWSIFYIKHSGRELRSSSIRSREISMILMTVSLSNLDTMRSTRVEKWGSSLNWLINSEGCMSIRYLKKSSRP